MGTRKGLFTIANLLVALIFVLVLGWLSPVLGEVFRELYAGASGLNKIGVFLGGLSPLVMVLLYILYSMETDEFQR